MWITSFLEQTGGVSLLILFCFVLKANFAASFSLVFFLFKFCLSGVEAGANAVPYTMFSNCADPATRRIFCRYFRDSILQLYVL